MFDDIEDVLPKGLDQPLRKVRADTLYHPRAQVFFDAFQGAWQHRLQVARLELETVSAVVDPPAIRLDKLPRADIGRRANDRD